MKNGLICNKRRNKRKTAILLFLFLCFTACKNESDIPDLKPYDPSLPVEITGFIPKTGGMGQRLVIYGNNFGNDTSIVNVFIGNKKAKLIGVNNDGLYCLVPAKAYNGNIEVHIGNGENPVVATSEEKFDYQRKMIVTTLCGYKDQYGQYETKDGPFSDCGGFYNPSWLVFDPKDPKKLYMEQNGGNVRLLNFRDSMVTTPITRGMGGWKYMRTIDFTPDGEYMVISNDVWDGTASISTSILSRKNGFKDPQVLTSGAQACTTAAFHPVNGELYFNSYVNGEFYRFDMEKYFNGTVDPKDYEELFKVQDRGWEYHILIHPTGNYAYIVVVNQHYILRTDYNWTTKRFMHPYVVCGEAYAWGWEDGVGSKVRLHGPYQGVFVKNPEYAGKEDEYDFYFTERWNHCIRLLTPEGKVTTFAGRGSSSVNPNPWGYIDGDLRLEARLDQPRGIAYDAENHVFYVGDTWNRRIRKIALEEE